MLYTSYTLKLTDIFYDHSPTLWINIFTTCSLVHASMLSSLFVLATWNESFNAAYTVTLVVCAGMSSGAISALAPNLFSALTFSPVLLLPTIIVSFYSEELRPTGWVMLIYLSYLSTLAVRTNREYLRTFAIEDQLKQQKKELETLSRTDAGTRLH